MVKECELIREIRSLISIDLEEVLSKHPSLELQEAIKLMDKDKLLFILISCLCLDNKLSHKSSEESGKSADTHLVNRVKKLFSDQPEYKVPTDSIDHFNTIFDN